ncbi:MAG: hypothetical protein ABIS36_21205 [Chryseolinea sp.]
MKYVGIVMALVYVGAGIALILQAGDSLRFPSQFTIPFGIVLIAYGAFRGYSAYKNYHE